jgi:hypothetical protein
MTVSVADHLTARGAATLRCTTTASANDAFIRQIRITAIKVAKLTVTELGQTNKVVYGTGAPEAVWGWSEGVTTLTPPATSSAGLLPLAAGNWWSLVNASFSAVSAGANGGCDFRISQPDRKFGYTLSQHGLPGDRQEISSQVTGHLSNPYAALFACTAGTGTAQVQQVFIAAIRLGQLRDQNAQGVKTYGHGTPLGLALQNNGGHTIYNGAFAKLPRSLSLSAGSWLVHGTLTVSDLYHVAAVHCILKVGTATVDAADTRLSLNATSANFDQQLVFDAKVAVATSAKATILCETSDTSGDAAAGNLGLFALRTIG